MSINSEKIDGRNAHADNVKGFAIILVVLGHLIWPLHPQDHVTLFIYKWIYLFHMPLFAMVSGYFSHAKIMDRGSIQKIANLIAVYIVFVLIHFFIMSMYGVSIEYFIGDYGLWYILSLVSWRIMLPLFIRLPCYIFVSICLAVVVGYVGWVGLPFSLSRTFSFFPFFILGYSIKKKHMELSGIINKYIAMSVIILSVIVCWKLRDGKDMLLMVWCADPYVNYNAGIHTAAYYRILRLISAFIISLAVLSLIPKRKISLTWIGQNSINVYLLHSIVVIVHRNNNAIYSYLDKTSILIVVILSLLLSVSLASKFLAKIVFPVTNPMMFIKHKLKVI